MPENDLERQRDTHLMVTLNQSLLFLHLFLYELEFLFSHRI